jgi:hypothetical protein
VADWGNNEHHSMKTELLKLGSFIPHGVEGPECGAINLIYTFLLQEHGITHYRFIKVEQVDNSLKEAVLFGMNGAQTVSIVVPYPAPDDYEHKTSRERDLIRLDIVHKGLLLLAQQDMKVDVPTLELIKRTILERNFSFDIVYKEFANPNSDGLIAKLVIHPQEDRFDFYVTVEQAGQQLCKALIYSGLTFDYFAELFYYGKWNGLSELVISGKKSQTTVHMHIDNCTITYENSSAFQTDPLFEFYKAGLSKDDRHRVYLELTQSLPPQF